MTIKPVTEQPLFIEREKVEGLQEHEEVISFVTLLPENELNFRVYPEAIMKIATDALLSLDQIAEGKNFLVSHAITRLRLAGVPIVC